MIKSKAEEERKMWKTPEKLKCNKQLVICAFSVQWISVDSSSIKVLHSPHSPQCWPSLRQVDKTARIVQQLLNCSICSTMAIKTPLETVTSFRWDIIRRPASPALSNRSTKMSSFIGDKHDRDDAAAQVPIVKVYISVCAACNGDKA